MTKEVVSFTLRDDGSISINGQAVSSKNVDEVHRELCTVIVEKLLV